LQQATTLNAEVLLVSTALEMATIRGGRALGMEKEIGSLVVLDARILTPDPAQIPRKAAEYRARVSASPKQDRILARINCWKG
jgi:cytosine/adenosine deaminase-related metal-dependent hydrolase